MAGAQVEEVFAGIAGEHVQAMTSKGIVAVSHDEITKSDVDRANEVARAQAIPQDRELLHAIPQEYTVDRNTGIRDPDRDERHAARDGDVPRDDRQLAADQSAQVDRARGLQACESSCSSRSPARSPCSPRTKRSSASRSWRWAPAPRTSSIFHEGKIRHLGTIAFGGKNVTRDIVHGLGRHAGRRRAAEGALRLRVRAASSIPAR